MKTKRDYGENPLTKEDLAARINVIRSNISFWSFKADISSKSKKDYSDLLENVFKDDILQNIVSYLVFVECNKANILSFDNIIGAYNIAEIYDPKRCGQIVVHAESQAKSVKDMIWIMSVAKTKMVRSTMWNRAKTIATRFEDYKEMYLQTWASPVIPYEYIFDMLDLMEQSAKTEEQKSYVINDKKNKN